MNTAAVAMISRAVGAADRDRANHVAGQVVLLALAAAAVIGTAGYLSAGPVLRFLGAEPGVAELGTGYLHIIFSGIFFMFAIFLVGAILQGTGDTVTPLLLGVVATVVNVSLNPVLIFGLLGFPAMGVNGSALATVIARGVAMSVGIGLLLRGRLGIRLRWKDFRPRAETLWRLLVIGTPSSAQLSTRMILNVLLMALVALFGTQVVAAYAVGMRVFMIGLFMSIGFGSAAAIMVGQNLGARRPDRARRAALSATGLALAASSFVGIVFLLFGRHVVTVFNNEPAVVSAGVEYLRFAGLVLCVSPVGIVLSRAMNGAGDTVPPLVISIIALWGFQIPAAVYLSGIESIWGITIPLRGLFSSLSTGSQLGIWYAMAGASALQGTLVAAWFATGRWKHRKA
jgi:putative MATE family efflux protein